MITVLFFGHYRDAVPTGVLQATLPRTMSVKEVASLLADRDRRFADLLKRTRQAINAEFVSADTVLQEGDELAFLPPMSGG